MKTIMKRVILVALALVIGLSTLLPAVEAKAAQPVAYEDQAASSDTEVSAAAAQASSVKGKAWAAAVAIAVVAGIGAFSKRENEPEKASRPFDAGRDGLVPGGGAATVIIESYESAVKRGAPIIAEVLGYGFSSNGDHISSPNVDGPRKALLMALEQSGITKEQVGYINAHATSTSVGDTNESKAIYSVFGDNMPPVTSTKGQTGHEMWMAGASEVIYSMLMMKNRFIAPNLNFEHGDEDTSKLNIPAQRIDNYDFDIFLSNSFGFGGTNSTLIIKDIK